MNLPVQGKVNRDGGTSCASVNWPRQPGPPTKSRRFYEESGLLRPTERAVNGYRDYGPEALSRLDFIRRGQAAGLALPQIREAGDTLPPCAPTADGVSDRHRSADR